MKTNSTRFNFLGRKGRIMKNVKGLFFLSFICLALGFSSCIPDGGNSYSGTAFAIVENNSTSGLSFSSDYGIIAAPQLEGKYSPGDCGYASFTVDRDNQPSAGYETANSLEWIEIPVASSKLEGGDMIDLFVDTLTSITPIYNPNLKGRFFFQLIQKASSTQEYQYELICNTDSVKTDSIKGAIVTVYLKSKRSNTSTGTESVLTKYQAFDIRSIFSRYGKPGDNLVSLNIIIKYQTGKDMTGKPIYTTFPFQNDDNVVTIYM